MANKNIFKKIGKLFKKKPTTSNPQGQLVGTGGTQLSRREQKKQDRWLQSNFNRPEAPTFYTEQKKKLDSKKQALSGTRKQIRRTRRTKIARTFDKIVGRERNFQELHDPKKLNLAGKPVPGKSLVGVQIGRRLYQKTDAGGYIKTKFNKKGIRTKVTKISQRKYGRAVGAVELGKRGTAGSIGTRRTIGKNPISLGAIPHRDYNVKPELSRKKELKKDIKKIRKLGIR